MVEKSGPVGLGTAVVQRWMKRLYLIAPVLVHIF